jgi:hypothetical protein
MLYFWVVTSRGLVGRYHRFGGTYCLHLPCNGKDKKKQKDKMDEKDGRNTENKNKIKKDEEELLRFRRKRRSLRKGERRRKINL